MTTFPGVATLDDAPVAVTVGLHDQTLSLVSGDRNLGEWDAGACDVVEVDSKTFLIKADHDAITFHPDDPGRFARGLSLWSNPGAPRSTDTLDPSGPVAPGEAPLPGTVTRVAFYVLSGITGGLMIWAIVRVFG